MMKKVLVVSVALAMMAAPALALTIVNSKHDMSKSSTTTGPKATTNDEVCVFCHTPHNAGAVGFAPLWNRTTAQATAIYTGVAKNNNATLTKVNSSDAPLCLSCHDGASLDKPLKNPSNRFSVANNTAGLADISNANANLGTDLRNDHPVGFNYDATLVSADTELNTLAEATGDGAQFFKGDTMWCSSCHDVHDNTYGAFLITSNSASKLCLACHIK